MFNRFLFFLKRLLGYSYDFFGHADTVYLIEYGFHLYAMGKSYQLFKKNRGRWKEVKGVWSFFIVNSTRSERITYLLQLHFKNNKYPTFDEII